MEDRVYKRLAIIGALKAAAAFSILLGIRRQATVVSPTSNPGFLDTIFSLAVNLAPAALIAFSNLSPHPLIKYLSIFLSQDQNY